MLALSAQGLYWIGRHLERARHSCRLLADQMESLEDRLVEEIDRSWRRLYAALGREPVGGSLSSSKGDEGFMRADAYTLVDDLTFETRNPDSIHNCLSQARENARQVRNVISRDMWSCLNIAHLGLRDLRIADIWNDRPGEFYRRTEEAIRAFSGTVEVTMYRDEGWHFLRLGCFVERAQLLASLVDAHLGVFPTDEPHVGTDWRSLLHICEARAAYRRLHSLDFQPDTVVDLLVSDPLLSSSIRHSLARIQDALDAISAHRSRPPTVVARRAGRMAALIDYEWPDRGPGDDDATRAVLREIRESCHHLHENIVAAYFDYEIEDTPGP